MLKAFHFLNWNLRVKSSVEEEEEDGRKEATPRDMSSTSEKSRERSAPPLASGNDVTPRKEEKVKDVKKQPVQDQTSIFAKTKKRGATEGLQTTTPKSRKTGNESGGKLFRSSLQGYISCKPKASDDRDRNRTARASKLDAGPTVTVHYGIDPTTASKVNTQETNCIFPEHKQLLLDCLVDGTVKINQNGRNIIDERDLGALLGGHPRDKDNYLNNFVIDAYLNVLIKNRPPTMKAESLEWEEFETKPVKEVLKSKAAILEQDVVMVPCNSGHSEHWFLLVLLPREKKIVALDSKAGAFTKPTVESAITKMWNCLQQLDAGLDMSEWCFSCNSQQDIPQQQNGFDCGVYVCAYARCLVLQSPMVSGCSLQSFRKHMILELHQQEVERLDGQAINEGKYYAVEYQKAFYFGRALKCQNDSLIKFKFLHSTGARVFDWPRRDDIDTCHKSCVFYGPVAIEGVGPFTLPQLTEAEHVYQHLRKSRKTS